MLICTRLCNLFSDIADCLHRNKPRVTIWGDIVRNRLCYIGLVTILISSQRGYVGYWAFDYLDFESAWVCGFPCCFFVLLKVSFRQFFVLLKVSFRHEIPSFCLLLFHLVCFCLPVFFSSTSPLFHSSNISIFSREFF